MAVFGTGGVGGYFGGRLAESGADVSFIARGAHLAALRGQGLTILSPEGDIHVRQIQASDDPGTIGPVDLVLFAVKLYDTEAALRALPALVGPQTLVVSLQNGIDSLERVKETVGPDHVAGGTAYVAAVIAEPGVIRHTAMGRVIVGSLDGTRSAILETFVDACTAAGFGARASDQIMVDIWAKFAGLTALSGMTAVARSPIGLVCQDPDLLAMLKAALSESIAVARARNVPLPESLFGDIMSATTALPPNLRSSMLEDLERGKPLELPWLSGTVARLGDELGVPTPTHRLIVTLLKPHVHGSATNAY